MPDYSKLNLGDPLKINNMDYANINFADDANSTPLDSYNDLRNVSSGVKDPFSQMGAQYFDASSKGFNYERYYNHPKFNKLGFSPYRDNEAVYNANSSWLDEMSRASGQWGTLAKIGAMSNIKSMGRMLGGDFSPDLSEAREYERAANIGSSSKGGIGGFTTNLYLNSGYTVGMIAEIFAEEAIMAIGSAVTFGGAAPAAGVRTGYNAGKLGKAFSNMFDYTKAVKSFDKVKDVSNMSKANNFYKNANKVGDFLNPLSGTTNTLRNWDKMDNLTNLAKTSKTAANFYRDVRELNMVVSESQLEAGMAFNSVKDDLYDEYITQNGKAPGVDDMEKISNAALAAQDMSFYSNLGLIYMTNKVSFAPIFKKFKGGVSTDLFQGQGYKMILNKEGLKDATQQAVKVVKDGTNKLFSKATLKNPKAGLKATALGALKYSKANFSEGIQEYFQESISEGATSYAKDLYSDNLEGGYWNYMADGIKSMANGQGFEVFMSGFLMGAPITLAQKTGIKTFDYADAKIFKKKAAEKKEKKEQIIKNAEKTADILNDWLKNNPQDFFNSNIEALRNQSTSQSKMDEAEMTGDQKAYQDAKSAKDIARALDIIKSPQKFEHFKSIYNELASLSDDELVSAFGVKGQSGESIRNSIYNDLNRVHKIQQTRKKLEKINPFNPNISKLKEPSSEDIAQVIGYNAWEAAIDDVTFLQEDFDNTISRITKLGDELLNNNMFSVFKSVSYGGKTKISPQDVQATFSVEGMAQQLSLLNAEIEALSYAENKTPEEVKLLKNKRQQARSLKRLFETVNVNTEKTKEESENLKEYLKELQKEISEYESLDLTEKYQNKLKELKDQEAYIRTKHFERDGSLRDTYLDLKNYFKTLAEVNGEIFDATNFDEMFVKYKDLYALREDGNNLSKSINVLADPKGFMNHFTALEQSYRDKWANRKDYLKEVLETHYTSEEMNKLANELLDKFGVFLLPEDLAKIFDEESEQRFPNEIFDAHTLKPVQNPTVVAEVIQYLAKGILKPIQEEITKEEGEGKIEDAIDQEKYPNIFKYATFIFPQSEGGNDLSIDFFNEIVDAFTALDKDEQEAYGDVDILFEKNPKVIQNLKSKYKILGETQAKEDAEKAKVKEVVDEEAVKVDKQQETLDKLSALQEKNKNFKTVTTTISKPTQQSNETEAKKVELEALIDREMIFLESEEISKTIDEFSNTNLDRNGKENLLLSDIQNIVEDWGIDEQSVSEYMKMQGTTLIKAVWRNNKAEFFKLLEAWKKATELKAELKSTQQDGGSKSQTSIYTDGKLKLERQSNFKDRVNGTTTESNDNMAQGAARGNLADIVGRDIFDGKTKEEVKANRENYLETANEMNAKSSRFKVNIEQEQFEIMVDAFFTLKDNLEKQGYKFVANDVFTYMEFTDAEKKATGLDGVGGTLDLVAVAPDGTIAIIDFKTLKAGNQTTAAKYIFNEGEFEPRVKGWSDQQTIYEDLLRSSEGIESSSINIFTLVSNYEMDGDTVNVTSAEGFEQVTPESTVDGVPGLIKLKRSPITSLLKKAVKGYVDKETVKKKVEDDSIIPAKGQKIPTGIDPNIAIDLEESPLNEQETEALASLKDTGFVIKSYTDKIKGIGVAQTKIFKHGNKLFKISYVGYRDSTEVYNTSIITEETPQLKAWSKGQGKSHVYIVQEITNEITDEILDEADIVSTSKYVKNVMKDVIPKIPSIHTIKDNALRDKVYTKIEKLLKSKENKLEKLLGGTANFTIFINNLVDEVIADYKNSINKPGPVGEVAEGSFVEVEGKQQKVVKQDKDSTTIKDADGETKQVKKTSTVTKTAVKKEKSMLSKDSVKAMIATLQVNSKKLDKDKALAKIKQDSKDFKSGFINALKNNCK